MPPGIEQHPFVDLLRIDPGLAAIRARSASMTPEQRRNAADLAYHQASTGGLLGLGDGSEDPWRGHLVALATDPEYAPAILTVGTLEYELGRPAEALALLETLFALPPDTEDLAVALDKAATYLGQQGDHEAALAFFRRALAIFPRNAELAKGPSWCLGHLGRHEEALAASREALALHPEDVELQTDLGWSLMEAGQVEEAAELLRQVVARSPDHELARGNLDEALARLGKPRPSARRRPRKTRKG